jgi:hypothetical protein
LVQLTKVLNKISPNFLTILVSLRNFGVNLLTIFARKVCHKLALLNALSVGEIGATGSPSIQFYPKNGAITFSIMTLNIMTLSIMTLRIMALRGRLSTVELV